ncbi:MAG TPA: GH92 family glycosyl hydrolase, partial [Verrucomicrobiae bacterium]|nr:GH92 family glycosyl hydrolase [Verrucomicrobiae bacterium]
MNHLHSPLKRLLPLAAPLIALALSANGADQTVTDQNRLYNYIRPLVGTAGEEGNTYPGPSAPFGMMQLSPDTGSCLTNWNTCSGYSYDDPTILGFSLTHLTGTGCPDLGDFLFMPQVGQPAFVWGDAADPETGYQSAYAHTDESASAGYYKVKLLKSGITTELTAGERAGMLRFTFPAGDRASIMIDLSHIIGPWKVAESHVRIENASTITGFHLINGWARERYLYFAARFSRPFDGTEIISSGKPVIYNTYRFRSRKEASGTNLQVFAQYDQTSPEEVIRVKVAISAVSAADARQNLDAEIPGWNFDKVREATRAKWDHALGKIQIEGTPEQKETFYTSVYHAMLAPNLFTDVNGKYHGFDQNIHHANHFTDYAVFSLWDTFRAENPLLALVDEPRESDFINSLLVHYDQSVDHLLPMW